MILVNMKILTAMALAGPEVSIPIIEMTVCETIRK